MATRERNLDSPWPHPAPAASEGSRLPDNKEQQTNARLDDEVVVALRLTLALPCFDVAATGLAGLKVATYVPPKRHTDALALPPEGRGTQGKADTSIDGAGMRAVAAQRQEACS